jgi:hypothetical protein
MYMGVRPHGGSNIEQAFLLSEDGELVVTTANTTSSTNPTLTDLLGLEIRSYYNGTGRVTTNHQGFNAHVVLASGATDGTTGLMRAGNYALENNDAGTTITTATGLAVDRPVNAGTITNTYGLRIRNQTAAAGTQTNTPFAIWQEGTADINQFAGVSNFGDGTNQASFANDGELTLAGTARVIRHYNIPLEASVGASSPTVDVSDAPFLSWEFDINDDTHHTFMAPHDMDYTQAANVYVVWYTDTDQTDDEVNWQVQWNARADGEAVNAGSTTDTSGDVNCPTQWQVEHTLVETITANSIAADDVIGIDLTRIAIVDGTDPAANTIFVLAFHFEYTANKLGEAT